MVRHHVAWLLAFTMGLACGANGDPEPSFEEERLAALQAEIDGLIEAGHELEPLPALSSDEVAEREVRMHRVNVADEMRAETASAMAPLAAAAALFAPEGAVDLLLTVVPAERIGMAAAKVAKRGLRARKRSKRAKELTRLNREFQAMLGARDQEFLRLAGQLTRAQRQALRTVFEHSRSPRLVERLLYLQHQREADVTWIATKLEKGRVDYQMAERFTFDAGLVEDITMHDSGISWLDLQRVVDGDEIGDAAREALAGKITGLMGERAARDMVGSPPFMRRHSLARPDKPLAAGEGITYRAGPRYGDDKRALDILAFTLEREAVFVEVKTWSGATWAIPGRVEKIVEQLRRHDEGIAEIMIRDDDVRTVKAKVLMVAREGYLVGLSVDKREDLETRLAGMGWVIETIPSSAIPSFADVIDGIR